MFHSQKDLVLSMPWQFVVDLELGEFTPLDKFWLKNVKKISKKAKLDSIKQLRLVRLCRKAPSYVPYKGTYVPYEGTFGAPDQGQTLDV